MMDDGCIVDRALQGEKFEDDGYSLKSEIEKYLWELNNEDDGREQGVYHPSQLSRCARNLYYERIGVAPKGNIDAHLRMIFDTGHAVHEQLGKYIAGMFGLEQAIVEGRVVVDEFFIAGSADLILFHDDGTTRRVIDFKTINDKGFSRLQQPKIDAKGNVKPIGMRPYIWQIHSYMVGLDTPLSTLFYYNKNNSMILEYPVVFSLPLWLRIEGKLKGIEECVRNGTPPPREVDKWGCSTCKFHWKCQPPGVKARKS